MADRKRAERFGRRAETAIALWLRLQGWRIIDRRVRTPRGEIDLIALHRGTLVFVEVKARLRNAETALMAVNQHRIVEAARNWVGRHPNHQGRDMRFDVILLASGRWPRHVRHAFETSERTGGSWL